MPFESYHLNLLRQLPAATIAGAGPEEKSPAGWFKYFWAEAYIWEAEFLKESARLLPLFNVMFECPPGWAPPKLGGVSPKMLAEMQKRQVTLNLKGGMDWGVLARTRPAILLDALEALLNVGFRRIPISKNSVLATNDTSMDMVRFLKRFDHSTKIQLGWRGDTRSFKALVDSGGFICKAESLAGDYAIKMNMRQPWHPYSKLSIRSDMWYRRVSADNCKNTITSITRDFKTAAVFPQLSETGVFPGVEVKQDISQLAIQGRVPLARLSEVKVRETSGVEKTHLRFVDTVQVFLCMMNGLYFDTQQAQSDYTGTMPFNEIAIREVPAGDLLGAITYIRVHHGTTNQEGFTAIYSAAESVEVRPDILQRKTSTYSGPQLFQAALEEMTRAQQTFSAAWGESGATKAGAKLDPGSAVGVSRIIQVKRLSDNQIIYTA